jgi:hypothetical protein
MRVGTSFTITEGGPVQQSPPWWRAPLLAALAAVTVLLGAAPAYAANDPEGGTKKLRDALAEAARGQVEAQHKLKSSVARQKRLTAELAAAQRAQAELAPRVAAVAVKSYQFGRASKLSMLLGSTSSDVFLARLSGLEELAQLDGHKLKSYQDAVTQVRQDQLAIAQEIREQQKQVNIMARKKKLAEDALIAAGGGGSSGGFISANSPLAQPAPRNADGSWPRERCSIDDPTPASGCVTPRTLHALRAAKAAGFTRYVSCHRTGGGGEHPLGRACDVSASPNGFVNRAATGGDKAYGDRLAAFFVRNADRLGVMYVIWYRQIWLPGSGWRHYSGTGGPAAVHTNHVHLSML